MIATAVIAAYPDVCPDTDYHTKILVEGTRIYNLLHAERIPQLAFIKTVTKKVGRVKTTLNKRAY